MAKGELKPKKLLPKKLTPSRFYHELKEVRQGTINAFRSFKGKKPEDALVALTGAHARLGKVCAELQLMLEPAPVKPVPEAQPAAEGGPA